MTHCSCLTLKIFILSALYFSSAFLVAIAIGHFLARSNDRSG